MRLNSRLAAVQRRIKTGWVTLRFVVYVAGWEDSPLIPGVYFYPLSLRSPGSLQRKRGLTEAELQRRPLNGWLTNTHADKYHLQRYYSSRGLKNFPEVNGKQTHSPQSLNTLF